MLRKIFILFNILIVFVEAQEYGVLKKYSKEVILLNIQEHNFTDELVLFISKNGPESNNSGFTMNQLDLSKISQVTFIENNNQLAMDISFNEQIIPPVFLRKDAEIFQQESVSEHIRLIGNNLVTKSSSQRGEETHADKIIGFVRRDKDKQVQVSIQRKVNEYMYRSFLFDNNIAERKFTYQVNIKGSSSYFVDIFHRANNDENFVLQYCKYENLDDECDEFSTLSLPYGSTDIFYLQNLLLKHIFHLDFSMSDWKARELKWFISEYNGNGFRRGEIVFNSSGIFGFGGISLTESIKEKIEITLIKSEEKIDSPHKIILKDIEICFELIKNGNVEQIEEILMNMIDLEEGPPGGEAKVRLLLNCWLLNLYQLHRNEKVNLAEFEQKINDIVSSSKITQKGEFSEAHFSLFGDFSEYGLTNIPFFERKRITMRIFGDHGKIYYSDVVDRLIPREKAIEILNQDN